MNLGHLLSSVCSSGNFTVTQAGASLYEIIHFLWEPIFVANCWQSLTHWLPSWHYGTVTFCWLGAAVSHVFTIWAPRHYWLSALSPQADWGEQRADWGLTTEHHHWSLTWAHGLRSPLHIGGLVSMIVTGWHPAKTICSQSGEREKAALMSNRESHFKLVSRVIKQPQSSWQESNSKCQDVMRHRHGQLTNNGRKWLFSFRWLRMESWSFTIKITVNLGPKQGLGNSIFYFCNSFNF